MDIYPTINETSTNTTIGTSALPLKARLPKESEATGAECTTSNASCPAWLIEYLDDTASPSSDSIYPDNETIAGITGYWLLSSNPGDSNFAHNVDSWGHVSFGSISYANNGVRPVITVSKSSLQ